MFQVSRCSSSSCLLFTLMIVINLPGSWKDPTEKGGACLQVDKGSWPLRFGVIPTLHPPPYHGPSTKHSEDSSCCLSVIHFEVNFPLHKTPSPNAKHLFGKILNLRKSWKTSIISISIPFTKSQQLTFFPICFSFLSTFATFLSFSTYTFLPSPCRHTHTYTHTSDYLFYSRNKSIFIRSHDIIPMVNECNIDITI